MRRDVRTDNVVVLARTRDAIGYASAHQVVSDLFAQAGWDAPGAGGAAWNPLADFIRPGDVVVLKPNWVSHENQSGQGMDCMVTHASVIDAVLDYVLRAQPARVVVGDAPVQGCDFEALQDCAGYALVEARYAARGANVSWVDFRRTIIDGSRVSQGVRTDVQPLADYVLFDLGARSLLEPISHDAGKFRVTMYNPDLMRRNHALGRHRYLIARDVLEADVVINLPKLKTHKKAGVTGALKNIVGINGNKEYLPHHRLGGARLNGDCYAGNSYPKLVTEWLLDSANRRNGVSARILHIAARASYITARLVGADPNLDGSWHGNDTVWRTCLDLNRVFLFGRPDGTLAEAPARRVLTITDGIICGEGEGPLAPSPRPLGMMTLAVNPAAAEVVHAHLMGFDWRKLPIIREAFAGFELPIATFRPEAVELWFEGHRYRQPWPPLGGQPFVAPRQWQGHCEVDVPSSWHHAFTPTRAALPQEDA